MTTDLPCRALVACLFLSALGWGCAERKPDVPLATVTGHVTFRGTPLPNALVTFEPESGRTSSGRTSEAGEYTLLYMGKPWGAVVGKHRVRITTDNVIEDPATGTREVFKEILPSKYHVASVLVGEVQPGKNVIDFALTSD